MARGQVKSIINILTKRPSLESEFAVETSIANLYKFEDINELREIANQNAKPIIYIHDFGIELEDGVTDVWYFEHEALDKKYWYRFDFDINNGWKLDLDFIKDDIEKIYGEDGYNITYPNINAPTKHPVGWVKISQK